MKKRIKSIARHIVHMMYVPTDLGEFVIIGTNSAVYWVGTPSMNIQEAISWLKKYIIIDEILKQETEFLKVTALQLQEYAQGKRQNFKYTFDLYGTKFQKSVWQALQEIPYGATTTYTAIAQKIGNPKAVRAVGTAIGANPISIIIPCHRVIGKDNTLTGYAGGLEMKKRLLVLENRSFLN